MPNLFGCNSRLDPVAAMNHTGEFLFHYFHHYRRIAFLRLADEEMNVLGHHDVADDYKAISLPHLFQNL